MPNPSTAFAFRRDAGLVSIRATMQQVAREGLTGVLRFRPPSGVPVEVFCENGRLVVVTSRDAAVYSEGARDVLPDKVSPATLEAAVLEQARDGVPFFLTLGTHGLLSKAAAESLMHQFGQRCFARLWAVKASSLPYDFEVLDALPGFAMRLAARPETVDEWLLGTLRQLRPDDLADLARHEGMVGTPHPRKDGDAILRPLLLTTDERDFYKGADGRHSLPTLGKQLGLTPEDRFPAAPSLPLPGNAGLPPRTGGVRGDAADPSAPRVAAETLSVKTAGAKPACRISPPREIRLRRVRRKKGNAGRRQGQTLPATRPPA